MYFFLKFLIIFIFVVIVLVQLCVILVRNGMFYKKTKSSNLVTNFYCVLDIVYIYSWTKIENVLTYFGDPLCKKYIFLHVVFNLTMEWTPWDLATFSVARKCGCVDLRIIFFRFVWFLKVCEVMFIVPLTCSLRRLWQPLMHEKERKSDRNWRRWILVPQLNIMVTKGP